MEEQGLEYVPMNEMLKKQTLSLEGDWMRNGANVLDIIRELSEKEGGFNQSERFFYMNCFERIKTIMQEETDFIQGLEAAYYWYEENKGQIVFYPKMTETEQYILTKKNDSTRIQ